MSMALAMLYCYYTSGVTSSILLAASAATWKALCALVLTRLDLRGTASLGNGTALVYPSGRVPTHPLRALGAAARGRYLCDLAS